MFCPRLLIFLVAAMLGALPAQAKPNPEDILSAVVGIRSSIPKQARTAKFLGTVREGSGAVIDDNGLILTIGYIILEAEKIEVMSRDGKVSPATFVGYDADSGFGVIRALKPLNATPLQLGVAAQLQRESPVLVVSAAGKAEMKRAMIVSRRNFAGYWEYLLEDAIFTAPPMANFAGAALINTDLKLVGIGSLFVRDAAEEGVHFPGNMFVPIDKLYPVLADLIATGRSSAPAKPWLGVYVTEMIGRVVVTRVAQGGPAEKLGLKQGDIVLKIAGQPVRGMEGFYRKLWGLGKAGVFVELDVLQGVEVKAVTIKSDDRYHHYRGGRMR